MSVIKSFRSKARKSIHKATGAVGIASPVASGSGSSSSLDGIDALSPQEWHRKAARYCQNGRWDEALEIMLELVNQFAENISLHTETAYIYHKGLGQYDKAEQYYSQALTLCEGPASLKAAAKTSSLDQDSSSDDATSDGRDSADASGDTIDESAAVERRKRRAMEKAKRKKRRKKRKLAAAAAAGAVEIQISDIKHKDLYFLTLSNYLCLLAENLGRLEPAMGVLTKLVKTKSEPTAEEWSYYAHVLCYIGDFDQSLRVFEKSLELDHNNPTTHYRLARTLLVCSRLEEALQSINKCIRIVQTTSGDIGSSSGGSSSAASSAGKRGSLDASVPGPIGSSAPPKKGSDSMPEFDDGTGMSSSQLIASGELVPSVTSPSSHSRSVFAANFGEAFEIGVGGGSAASIYGLYFWLKGEIMFEMGDYANSSRFFQKCQKRVHGVDPYVNTLAHCGNLRICLITADIAQFEKVYTEFEKGGHIDMSLDWYILAMKAWYMSLKLRNTMAAELERTKLRETKKAAAKARSGGGGSDDESVSPKGTSAAAAALRKRHKHHTRDTTATTTILSDTREPEMPPDVLRSEELEKISLTFERALEIAIAKCEALNYKFIHGVHTVLYFYAMHSHYTERDLDKALELYNRILAYYRPHWAKIHLQIAAVHVLRAYSLNPVLKPVQRAYDHFAESDAA